MATGIVTRGNHPRLQQEGLTGIFGNGWNQLETKIPMLFDIKNSSKSNEIMLENDVIGPAPRKGEGEAISIDSTSQGIAPNYIHLAYAIAVHVTREAKDDDLYNQINDAVMGMGRSLRYTEEIVGTDIYNNAFDPLAVMPGGNGKSLIALDQPIGRTGNNFSNRLAVDTEISEASLESLSIQIGNAVDNRGNRMALGAKTVIIPNELSFETHRILKSVQQNDTANNAINAMRDMGMFPGGIVESKYLTNPSAWFIRTDVQKGLCKFVRVAPEFDNDNDFDTKNSKMSGYMRNSYGWDDPRALYGSNG